MPTHIPPPAPDVPGSPWRTTGVRAGYRNPWLRVTEYQVTRPDGTPGSYGVADLGTNVTTAALDDQGRVLLIRDFVYPLQAWCWSLPGGRAEPGEDVQAAAARELAEEGGVAADDWQLVGTFWLSPGITTEATYSFLARGVRAVPASPEPTETITTAWAPLAEAVARCFGGDIRDATAVLALLAARERLAR